MLWHELERTGVRLGLKEIDDRLTFSAAKACYLNWVKHLVAFLMSRSPKSQELGA